jgi:hypothetical protein
MFTMLIEDINIWLHPTSTTVSISKKIIHCLPNILLNKKQAVLSVFYKNVKLMWCLNVGVCTGNVNTEHRFSKDVYT